MIYICEFPPSVQCHIKGNRDFSISESNIFFLECLFFSSTLTGVHPDST
jgi:hypothetical protein